MQRARRYACPGQSHKSGSRPTCPLLVPPPLRRTVALRPDEHGGRPLSAPALPVERLPDPGGDQLRSSTTGTAGAGVHRPFCRSGQPSCVTVARCAPCCSSSPPSWRRGARRRCRERPSAVAPAPLPPRPREVRLDGVDPCSLLISDQRVEVLGLESAPTTRALRTSQLFRGDVPTCTMIGFRPDAIGLASALSQPLVSNVGSETISRQKSARVTVSQAFLRLSPTDPFHDDYCSVEVDVASGQLLDVQFSDGGRQPPIAQDDLCVRADALQRR